MSWTCVNSVKITSGLPWRTVIRRKTESVTPSMGDRPSTGVESLFQNVIGWAPRGVGRRRSPPRRPHAAVPLHGEPSPEAPAPVPRRTLTADRFSRGRNHTADRPLSTYETTKARTRRGGHQLRSDLCRYRETCRSAHRPNEGFRKADTHERSDRDPTALLLRPATGVRPVVAALTRSAHTGHSLPRDQTGRCRPRAFDHQLPVARKRLRTPVSF